MSAEVTVRVEQGGEKLPNSSTVYRISAMVLIFRTLGSLRDTGDPVGEMDCQE